MWALYNILMCPLPNLSPPLPPTGPTSAAAAVAQGGAGGLNATGDLVVFAHLPPNIFRLHVHFVHRSKPLWAPLHEVWLLEELLATLSSGGMSTVQMSELLQLPLNCGKWD